MDQINRLYIFTGKGGVGKSVLSLSFCQYLRSLGKKAELVYFKNNAIKSGPAKEQQSLEHVANSLGVPVNGLELTSTAQEYVAKKMKSDTIARWVIKTPFFKALINMIPGFSYLIYLGKVLEMLKNDPELILVLDSPSSGHALTMLESTHNFNEIFHSGLLFEDTKKMLDTMYSEHFTQVNIVALPTMMAVNEALELKASINKVAKLDTKVVINNSFYKMQGIENMKRPTFLEEKLKNEEAVIEAFGEQVSNFVPHIPTLKMEVVARESTASMPKLI